MPAKSSKNVLPIDPSSNWKQLQQNLKSEQPPKPEASTSKKKSKSKLHKTRNGSIKKSSTRLHSPSSKPLTSDTSLAIDCEMVGGGADGSVDILARVSIVNADGKCVYDKYVKPDAKVTDYRTHVSGIRPSDIYDGADVIIVKEEVRTLIEGKILIAHGLRHDLRVLNVAHPLPLRRDTSKFRLFRSQAQLNINLTPSLKKLACALLGINIQSGEHDSIVDARIAMRLYQLKRKEWEKITKEKKRMKVKAKRRKC